MTGPLPTVLSATDLAASTHMLSKRYGKQPAVTNLDLQLPLGAVYLLVGANGAGKTTTLKILLDLLRPTSGVAEVLGLDPQRQAARVRANVGYVPERLEWGYEWMRVGRLLEHHACYYPAWDWAYARQLSHTFDLKLARRMGTLSKGQARRVHLAMALAHRPPMLVLDEPTDGLDPVMRDETIGVLVEHLADTPTTVLLSTHHVAEFELFADHVGMLRQGELRAQLPVVDLQRHLHRYRAEVPADWRGDTLLGARALRKTTTPKDIDWTVWGEESEVVAMLHASGAVVHDVVSLSLSNATLALLSVKDESNGGVAAGGADNARKVFLTAPEALT